MNIAVIELGVSRRGSIGISTIATNLVVELARRGEEPVLVDFERSFGTSVQFIKKRDEHTRDVGIFATPSISTMKRSMSGSRSHVFDAGRFDSEMTSQLLPLVDVVLVPVGNKKSEKEALLSLAAQTKSQDVKMILVPSKIFAGDDEEDAMSYFSGFLNLGFSVSGVIHKREEFVKALRLGCSVSELKYNECGHQIIDLLDVCEYRLRGTK